MDIIVTRSRIAGTLPFYEYRALVPADDVPARRRKHFTAVQAPRVAGRIACMRLAAILAPDALLDLSPSARAAAGQRLAKLAKTVETVIVKAVFPEMIAPRVPVIFTLPGDPGDACVWTSADDLTGAFARLAALADDLTPDDIGLAARPQAIAA